MENFYGEDSSGVSFRLRPYRAFGESRGGRCGAELIAIDQNGDISDEAWQTLDEADAIIFGSPTYMGGPSWQFKKFADASSKAWFGRKWQDKVFGGFTNSASLNGDKAGHVDRAADAGFATWRPVGQSEAAAGQHQIGAAYRRQ